MTTTDDRLIRSTVLSTARLALEAERADLRATLDEPPDDQIDGVARTALLDIEAALARLAAGTYGICTSCSSPIPHERLAVLPTTPTCVGCRAAVESEISAVDS